MSRRAKSVMIQGTMSNAGKSLLCAGLCRIFARDGYRVAPFKSQNMALNSYVTALGGEMGRAQVLQAQAAGITPHTDMNPVLLKPTSDVGSQVIVEGKAIADMPAREYFAYKKELRPVIEAAYDRLARRHDIIVIEGAGSPAEINLKADDIVNMGMARMAQAPVLLAGDIDRGGVFAQLYGTIALLEPEEKANVKGLLINKFRGERALLEGGLQQLERLTGVPVLGVVPYLSIDLEDEDSLSDKFNGSAGDGVDIAVIRLPKISNFTDFDPLARRGDVNLRYVGRAEELGDPDLIVLPGTKNTLVDLRHLRQNGLEDAISVAHCSGSIVFGICGGMQMMGRRIDDRSAVEGGGVEQGMGLLDLNTVFEKKKVTRQTQGVLGGLEGVLSPLNGCAFCGYEIHMGRSGEAEGIVGKDRAYGTYVHGIFDCPELTETLLGAIARSRGKRWQSVAALSPDVYREKQFDILEEALRVALDIPQIYRIIEEGGQWNRAD